MKHDRRRVTLCGMLLVQDDYARTAPLYLALQTAAALALSRGAG